MSSPFIESFPYEILSFLENHNVDYALMLKGDWGSGKSYYCTYELPGRLKKFRDSLRVINVSLYGKRSIDSIKVDLAYKLFLLDSNIETNRRSLIGGILQDNFPIIADGLSNTTARTSLRVVSRILNRFSNELISSLKGINVKRDVLIVFDDLERCDKDCLISLLGQINSAFIEQHFHVLFVANEEELIKDSEEFLKKKEKLIRTTFTFCCSLKETLVSVICKRKETCASRCFVKEKAKEFDKAIDAHLNRIVNLRTWLFAFDLFDSLVFRAKIKDNPYLVQLFVILIITIYYKVSNPEVFKYEMNIFQNDSKKPSFDRQIHNDFSITCHFLSYNRAWRLDTYEGEFDFYRIDSIEKYIDSGFLDVEKFKNEFDNLYPVGTKYELALVKLNKYERLNENEFIEALEIIFDGISCGKYSLRQLKNISIMLEYFNEFGYLSLFNNVFDYKTALTRAITEQLEKRKLSIWKEMDDPLASEYKSFGEGFPEYLNGIINSIIYEGRSEYQKEEFASLFSNLGKYALYDIPEKLKQGLAEKIINYDLLDCFLSFSNVDLCTFSAYLDSISYPSNCGDIPCYYSEVPFLRRIRQYLYEACCNKKFSGKMLFDIKRIIKQIDNTCTKLETSHSKDKE